MAAVIVEFTLVNHFLYPLKDFLAKSGAQELPALSLSVLKWGVLQQNIFIFPSCLLLIIGSVVLLWKTRGAKFARVWVTIFSALFVLFSLLIVVLLFRPYLQYLEAHPEKAPVPPVKLEIEFQNEPGDS